MLRRSVFLLLALVVAALACGGPLAGSPTSAPAPAATVENTATPISRTAILSELLNQVEARQDAQVDWQTATDGQQIGVGGAAKTSNESRVRIDTSEGTIVRVAPNSEFELTVFSPQVTNPVTRLKLAVGKLWALVLGIQEPGAFEIETPTGSATVRGSLMSVEQDSASGRMLITCLEGQCRLSNPAEVSVDLAAGQQSEIPAPDQDPQPARPMDQTQLEDWLLNFPEAQTAVQRVLDQLREQATPTPPPPTGFNVSNTGATDLPQLAFDAQGILHVAWVDTSLQSTGSVFHRQLGADGQWSEVENLSPDLAYVFGGPSLLRRADGSICVVWNGAEPLTLYVRCRTEQGWTEAEALNKPGRDYSPIISSDGTVQTLYVVGAGTIYFEDLELSADLSALGKLVVDAAGGYHAAWVRLGEPFSVEHRYSTDGSQTWAEAERLSTEENRPDALSMRMEADSVGGVHIVWRGNEDLYYRRWTANGGWEAVVELSRDAPIGNLAISTDANGLARVIWQSVSEGVWYTEQSADGAWSAPRQLTTEYYNWGANGPAIAVDSQGRVHMVWKSEGSGTDDLYYFTLP